MNTTTSTLEPQTAEYQAAMDNVYFEQTVEAGYEKSDFYMSSFKTRYERIAYITDLETRMGWELGTKKLGYTLDI